MRDPQTQGSPLGDQFSLSVPVSLSPAAFTAFIFAGSHRFARLGFKNLVQDLLDQLLQPIIVDQKALDFLAVNTNLVLGHLFFLLDFVFWSNQNLLEDDGLFYPQETPEFTALYGHYLNNTDLCAKP
jgi:hypothetical protein